MLSLEEIQKVALLARLELSAEEQAKMTEQLGRIVDYIQQLETLDTDGVEPVAHVMDLVNVFAEDQLRPSLPREQALANAPKRDEEYFRVPAVLGD